MTTELRKVHTFILRVGSNPNTGPPAVSEETKVLGLVIATLLEEGWNSHRHTNTQGTKRIDFRLFLKFQAVKCWNPIPASVWSEFFLFNLSVIQHRGGERKRQEMSEWPSNGDPIFHREKDKSFKRSPEINHTEGQPTGSNSKKDILFLSGKNAN